MAFYAGHADACFAIGYWLLAIGYWLSAIGYWLLNELQASSGLLSQMKVERVKYVIWAADSKRAVRFYREVFGAEVTKESEVISERSGLCCKIACTFRVSSVREEGAQWE